MRGVRGYFNLLSYIICRSVHSLRSDLTEAFSVKSVDDVCAATQDNYLYSEKNYSLKLSYVNQVNVIYL